MKVFTICDVGVFSGAGVEKVAIRNGKVNIPAVVIGKDKQGCKRGVIPVQLANSQYKQWQKNGRVEIRYVDIGESKSKKPKLFAKNEAGDEKRAICVFRFINNVNVSTEYNGTNISQRHFDNIDFDQCGIEFGEFPGEIVMGANNMSIQEQMIAIIPKNSIFRVIRNNFPETGVAHVVYYFWNGWDLDVSFYTKNISG